MKFDWQSFISLRNRRHQNGEGYLCFAFPNNYKRVPGQSVHCSTSFCSLTVVVLYDNLSRMITMVEINESIQSQLDRDIKSGLLDNEVRDLIAFWSTEIKEIGYEEYIKSPLAKSFSDHGLKGKRQGERSIHLNTTGGRLIYKYYKNKIVVKVIKITPDHDYE